MNTSSPFDHDSLMYKLMKYLYKIQEQMQVVQYVWIMIDIVQFLTIITSILGYVIKNHFKIVEEDLFDNFLNIFFNYSKIYNWLVISGACSAFIVLTALIIYIIIEYKKQFRQDFRKKVLNYCALTGTIAIGLFEFFSQVMANNLINIVFQIFNRELEMEIGLIGFFLLNMVMMLFVSIFNSNRRIFRFGLVMVSLSLNMLPYTITCILLIVLSLYYQYLDEVAYKVLLIIRQKLFYFLIIATCIWCSLQVNDQSDYNISARFVYLSFGWVGLGLYFFYYQKSFLNSSPMDQNEYLVELYKKRLKKQDHKQDYQLGDQYFIKFFDKQRQNQAIVRQSLNSEYYLATSCQDWHQSDFKQKLIEKIKCQRLQRITSVSTECQISYFQFLLQLKINMVELLKQVYLFMSQKRNQNIKIIYQINKLTNKIEKEFEKNQEEDESVLKIQEIMYLEELYKSFYQTYVEIVQLLQTIFDSLQTKKGEITQATQQKLEQFTKEQKILQLTLLEINKITGKKIQSKLYQILSQIWNKFQKSKQQQSSLSPDQGSNFTPTTQQKQKFNFSYITIANKTIKYASIKFLSNYSYKQSYITGQNISLIFPSKFSLYVLDLMQKNAHKKTFVAQLPIINQKGLFEIVNAMFYLVPEFKGQVTYVVQFRRISQFESKSLFLFNCQTLCIQCFNKRIINQFKFSLQKITSLLQTGAIQFSNLFIFNNEEKDFLTFTQKSTYTSARSKRPIENNPHQNYCQRAKQQKIASMKALMKMDYLTQMKKTIGKNVTLQSQITFDISNITYRVIKVDDASANKHQQQSQTIQKTEDVHFMKELNKASNGFQNSTKDLKKKYENQEFFCPIPNPYLPKILEKMNIISSKNRVTNVTFVKMAFCLLFLLFFAGIVAFNITQGDFAVKIVQFQKQAQTLNKQYSYFMEGILYAYQLHFMGLNEKQWKSYIQEKKNMSPQQSSQYFNDHLSYISNQKTKVIKMFQDAYFNFPILEDTPNIPIQIYNEGMFTLEGDSKSTLIYDIVVFLLDSQSQIIKQVISQNFQIYDRMMQILRPDGRYNQKILELNKIPSIILLAAGSSVSLGFILIYFLLYQLKQAKQDITLIYKFIEKRELNIYKKKILQIQELIEILSNNTKTVSQQPLSPTTTRQQFQTVSEMNSNSNLRSQARMTEMQSVSQFNEKDQIQQNVEDENEENLLICRNKSYLNRKPLAHTSYKTVSKPRIFLNTILTYPIYIIVLVMCLGILLYTYYRADVFADHYMGAFRYFQKVRAANFQFRHLYASSQRLAYFESVMERPYDIVDEHATNSFKRTHFEYEKPEEFVFQYDENLCNEQVLSNLTDTWFKDYQCQQIDDQMLTHGFSQAYERYERSLYELSDKSYQSIITTPELRQKYFNTIYEFYIFRNYLTKLASQNFQQNLEALQKQINSKQNIEFIGITLFVLGSLCLMFCYTFVKLQNELEMMVALIKMIPPETIFSMRIAALFKKRNILEKLNNL